MLHPGYNKAMCTRYCMEKGSTLLAPIIDKALASKLAKKFQLDMSKPMITEGEVRPTDVAPVIAPGKDGKRAVFPMKWGFSVQIEGKTKPVINARIETASAKALFKEAWARHRCVIPASWYIEWEHHKDSNGRITTGDRYVIQPNGDVITWLCGLYRIENGFPVFVILTREPTPELARIHDRMPVILPEDKIDGWIDPASDPTDCISFAISDMYAEISED